MFPSVDRGMNFISNFPGAHSCSDSPAIVLPGFQDHRNIRLKSRGYSRLKMLVQRYIVQT
ncbi:unnamed protein product [Prunus armeniaca]|uniref:Uncharacterized protein n=1 Tax=Prunus armeniaca TaxID=36596 RepID=A0A6J5U8G1_PRUAR|nr:unnamed protein product [Prunus armeniaca]